MTGLHNAIKRTHIDVTIEQSNSQWIDKSVNTIVLAGEALGEKMGWR